MFLDELNQRSSWDSPWRQLRGLQEQMNRLFDNVHPEGPEFPAVNVWTSEDSAVVTAEVPGIDAGSVDISVIGDTLTLKGEKKPDGASEDACCYRQERPAGSFFRSVQLPFRADAGNVEAAYKNGVLKVRIPRATEDKPHKIAVKAG